jgi:hypothetical protein
MKTQTPIEKLASKGPNGRKLAGVMLAMSKDGWTLGEVTRAAEGRYVVKCDDCKTTIRETDSLVESAAGGSCGCCHARR